MILRRIHIETFLIAFGFAVFSGCSTTNVPIPEVVDLKKQLIELQKAQGIQSARLDELNNKILLLKDRIDGRTENSPTEISNPGLAPQVRGAPSLPMTVPPPVTAAPQATGGTPPLELPTFQDQSAGPEKIYNQALQDAKKPQLGSLERDVDSLLKNFKESPLTNNALFLLAETHFERGQYAQGASQFERLYKTYPDGNKAVAALYRLGLCYEKMGHAGEAKEAYQNVMTVYPGSAEAVEAEKRLKLGGTKSP